MTQETVATRILDVVSRSPGCLLEDLTRACPDLTWNQIFLEVDHLSRSGQVILTRKGPGAYTIHLPDEGVKHS